MYTMAPFACVPARRGYQISLWMIVGHYMVVGTWTQDLGKDSQCPYPLFPALQEFLKQNIFLLHY